jgi:hypothetical protein
MILEEKINDLFSNIIEWLDFAIMTILVIIIFVTMVKKEYLPF